MLLSLYDIIMNVFVLRYYFLCINCYFTNIFCLSKLQKIVKKKDKLDKSDFRYLTLYYGMDWIISCFVFFYIHTCVESLCFEYVYYVLIFMTIIWLDFIISRSPEKKFC